MWAVICFPVFSTAHVCLLVAFGGTVVAGIIGIILGLIAGYFGGIVDSVIMRIMDGMLAFPLYPAGHHSDDGAGQRYFQRNFGHWHRQRAQFCPRCAR